MKKLALLVVTCGLLTACQTNGQGVGNNQTSGALIGGIAGGVLGSTIGSGTGKLVATGAGVLLGAMAGSSVGQNMDQPKQQIIVQQKSTVGECSHIQNSGVRASCERGISERNAEAQRQAEQSAYQCARYGRC